MLLAATVCLQWPVDHDSMHTRGIVGMLCVMSMCVRSRLEVLYGHEHDVERYRLYCRRESCDLGENLSILKIYTIV